MVMCVDEKTNDVVAQQTNPMETRSCTKNDVQASDSIVGESVCTSGAAPPLLGVVFTGNFNSASGRCKHNTSHPSWACGNSVVIGPVDRSCTPGQAWHSHSNIGTTKVNELKIFPRKSE